MPDPMMAPADADGLAAEYVLGTLDAPERATARSLLAEDREFAAKVELWERRLGELHLMVEPVEPDAQVWLLIKARLPEPPPGTLPEFKLDLEPKPAPEALSQPVTEPVRDAAPATQLHLPPAHIPAFEREPAVVPATEAKQASASDLADAAAAASPVAMPEIAPGGPITPADEAKHPLSEPEPAVEAPEAPPRVPEFIRPKPAEGTEGLGSEQKLRSLRRHLVGWRVVALVMALGLAGVAGLVAVWRYAPERLPAALRPVALMRLAGIRVDTAAPPRVPAPPESQFDE